MSAVCFATGLHYQEKHMVSLRVSAALAVTILAVGGCRPGDQQSSSAASTPAATAPAINVVTVHASDYAFQAPAQIPAGMTTFHLINDGPGIHHITLVRLDSAKSLADLLKVMQHPGPLPAWAVLAG